MAGAKVAMTDSVFPSLDLINDVLRPLDTKVILAEEPTLEGITAVAHDADGLLVTYAEVTAEVIQRLSRCKVISRTGIGVDNVDVEAATKAGIVVTRVPDYCIDEVSDHAMALLLALVRKIPFSSRMVHEGRWEMKAVTPIHRLRGQTLGLVGFGQIPRALVPKAQAFGLDLIAYDPYVSEEEMRSLGVGRVSFDELVERSDLISIHAPLTPDTHHMFDQDAFRAMKSSAYLVNTARGPLVDVEALGEGLAAGEIRGAGLDVLEEEPPAPGSAVLGRDDVIFTPHTGFYSVESLEELQRKAAQEVVSVLQGEAPRCPVNPEVLEQS